MKKSERTEDLNPRNEDIEEKVRLMLDPSVPDEPPVPVKTKKSTPKTIEIKADSMPVADKDKSKITPTAPELPTQTNKSTEVVKEAPATRKITITDHNDETPEQVAEKLDEAIAELDSKTSISKSIPITGHANLDEKEAESTALNEIPNQSESEPEVDIPAELDEPAILTAKETDQAVADIVASESDEILEIEDAVRDTDQPVKPAKKQHRSLIQNLKVWFKKPIVRWLLIIALVIGLAAAIIYPNSRYFALNTVGIRAKSSLIVLDSSTGQPLKNVEVKLGNVSSRTDSEGKVSLSKIKLGKTELNIQKRAFAPVTKTIIVGFGSNPLGDFELTPTGSQYSFTAIDYLSGKPLTKIEASSGDAVAVSDDKGGIKLTIDQKNDNPIEVTISGKNNRTELLTIDPNDKENHVVKLVPARKHLFVSKRSGKFDIYSVYIDGKDEKLVLAGSGSEQSEMALVPHPSQDLVAYVSTRGNQHNSDGFLLSNLLLINTNDNTTTNIDQSERIRIVDWSNERLVYVTIKAGSSGDNPKRYRLMSYDHKLATSKELASSNFFNDVVSAGGAIYYAPSSAFQTGNVGFYRINSDGSDKQTVFSQEVWNIFRTSYDKFALSVQQQWFEYRIGDKSPTKINSAPADQNSKIYINNSSATQAVWVDKRDGKGALLAFDINTKKDVLMRSQSGLGYPVRWLNDSVVVYRVKTDQETADYAISINGGEPVKIRDVTNSAGLNSWNY